MLNPNEMGVSAYWSSRPCNVDEAAELLGRSYEALAPLGRPFDNLHKVRDHRGEQRVRWSADRKACRKMILDGRNFTDIGHEEIASLGYVILFAEPKVALRKAGLGFSIGASGPGYPNSIQADLPVGSPRDQTTRRLLVDSLEAIVEVCDPDWATISSNEVSRLLPKPDGDGIRVGWYTYLSGREFNATGGPPSVPRGVTVHPMARGHIIQVTPQWFDTEDSAHATLLRDLDRNLRTY